MHTQTENGEKKERKKCSDLKETVHKRMHYYHQFIDGESTAAHTKCLPEPVVSKAQTLAQDSNKQH